MKRNMDLIRKILLAYETYDHFGDSLNELLEGYTEKEINYHQVIMRDAGLLEKLESYNLFMRLGNRMTWFGHDFLDASREETRWNKAKEIGVKAGGVTLEIMIQILKDLMLSQVKQVMG